MHHLCVEEEEYISPYVSSKSKASEWGQRVMTLRTGEALLYSPASLFVSKAGKLGTLGTGYAIMKMRARLTRDGGESLLATAPSLDETNPPASDLGILTPMSSSPPAMTTFFTPRVHPVQIPGIDTQMHGSSIHGANAKSGSYLGWQSTKSSFVTPNFTSTAAAVSNNIRTVPTQVSAECVSKKIADVVHIAYLTCRQGSNCQHEVSISRHPSIHQCSPDACGHSHSRPCTGSEADACIFDQI